MKSKILINGITIGEGSILPILLRAKYWQSQGCKITIFGNSRLRKEILSYKRINNYDFLELERYGCVTSKFQFIFEALRRNLLALQQIKNIKGQYNIIHSISSMLDFIIFPYILKFFDKEIKWVTVFDNIVPFSDPGNKFLRFLAWLFFQFSLVLLKRADIIFVISTDLRDFLIKRGFGKDHIVVSGNGIDVELMKKAKKDKRYNIDALFVGRINETKGIYDMLRIIEIVIKKYPNFKFAIMGRGDKATEDRFKRKIREKRLEKNVQFLGYKKGLEKFNIIKSSNFFWFLSVSDSESFGIALLEAVCLGLQTFVYNLKPFKKIYKNNEVFMFGKHDYKAVAKKILKMLARDKFENKNRVKLMDYYNWERIAKIEVDYFYDLISKK